MASRLLRAIRTRKAGRALNTSPDALREQASPPRSSPRGHSGRLPTFRQSWLRVELWHL